MTDIDKHSSLLQYGINYTRKKLLQYSPWISKDRANIPLAPTVKVGMSGMEEEAGDGCG